MCPACKRRQQCIKQLSLWSVPDIFIIHLKRFRSLSNTQRSKLSTLVLFPLSGLDMNSYLVPRKQRSNQRNGGISVIPDLSKAQPNNGNGLKSTTTALPPNSASLNGTWPSWQRPRIRNQSHSENNIYDLYAVCNHHGNMQGGHYTAYCKNPVDGRWFSYDDTKVAPMSEASVITADAYILFYQRSSLSSGASCASSSTSGYSSASSFSSPTESHWACRMPLPNRPRTPKSPTSQDDLACLVKQETTPTGMFVLDGF